MDRPLTASIVALTLSVASEGEKSARACAGDNSRAPAARTCNIGPPKRCLRSVQALLRAIVGHVFLPEVDGTGLAALCRQAALFDCNGLAGHHSLLIIAGVRDVGILAEDLAEVIGACAIG